MQITEETVRLVVKETIDALGPRANSTVVKAIVKEVVKRLSESAGPREVL